MKLRFAAALLLTAASVNSALAWDPWGDITNPGRIIENIDREGKKALEEIPKIPDNIQRELENVGREIDRMRLEFNAVTSAPLFEAWLNASRDTARARASPLPRHIRDALGRFYDDDIYNRVAFKIGDGGAINLANLSIHYGDAAAVTLVDTVIFADANGANDPVLWAHELAHVRQFRDWGVRDFAIRYLRSWNGVEGDAQAAATQYAQQFAGQQNPQRPSYPQGTVVISEQMRMPPPPETAAACYTNMGACLLGMPLARGVPCYCPSVVGPIWGVSN